jgi:predicted phosphodiesterase
VIFSVCPVVFALSSGPEQIHIAYGSSPSTMVVSWISTTQTASIQYGKAADSLTNELSVKGQSYSWESYTSAYIHHAVISDLTPATLYFYSCENGDRFNFTTGPTVSAETPFTFAIIGDLGQTMYSKETVNHVASNKDIQAILHVGDLSYADGVQTRWDSWGNLIQSLSAVTPWMVAAGNHEEEHSENFVAYQARFRMPFEESGATQGNLYYSMNVASAHIIVLCTYTDYSSSSSQYKWLQTDLNKIDRSLTPWVIVLMHAPWYNSYTDHQQEGEAMRLAMEPLLVAAKVDVVFAGHVHAYERCTRVVNYKVSSKGPYYLTVGDGGNREGLVDKYYDSPAWSAFRQSHYGHGVLQIFNSTTMEFTWRTDENPETDVQDRLVIQH